MNKLYEIIKLYYNGDMLEPTQQRITTMLPLLNQRQRRLFLACEARALGSGGISEVSKMSGVARFTIRRGLRELDDAKNIEEENGGRRRKPGPGQRSVKLRYPNIMNDLKELIEPSYTPAGTREEVLHYTGKSTKDIAEALKEKGLSICGFTIGNLLKEEGYSLQTPKKKMAIERRHPDREAQFKYINKKARSYMERGEAVLFIDAKEFKNKEKKGRRESAESLVYDADLLAKKLGKATAHEVYKLFRDAGLTSAGVTDDTAGFAVKSLRWWWETVGQKYYDHTRRILITADFCGGKGGILKFQELANELNKEITILHFPPGTTKWDKIGHRFFSFSGRDWREKPLVSAAVILSLISVAGIEPGLTVDYTPDYNMYKTKGKVSEEENSILNIKPHEFHGEWNYTILPKRNHRNVIYNPVPRAAVSGCVMEELS
ncbi:MAG: ISAzo13 family transposase [Treponema sp.]|nr:ISAzo13 family transposase [Treponema sp.]